MKRRRIENFKYILLVLLLALVAFVSPPADFVKRLQNNLEILRGQYAAEKVYLQLDKPYYAPGQAIWLKGYVLDATSLRPSAKSGVLYVDLLNIKNEPIERLTLKAENGKAKGDIPLPTDLPAGKYRLVAYTQWMRNFGEETFFNKEINVLGANNISQKASAVTGNIDFRFFPEGGDLVAGLTSRVAFKATSPSGTGVSISGSVYDDQGRKLVDFSDAHLGMGAFELQPQTNRRYVAKIKTADGKTTEYALPTTKATGFVMGIQETADGNNWQVTIAGNVTKPESLLLTGISREALQFSQNINLQSGQPYRLNIAKAKFPTGIARFNLARPNGEPLAERLVFADQNDDLNLTITTDKKTYAGRDKVTMQLAAKDNQGKPVTTDFALAVTDDELVKQSENGLNIKAHLLLASDLRGYVEQPGYYFQNNKDRQRKEALDYLLMTQGWRRFSWKEIAAGTFPDIKFANEAGLSIRGKLITNKGKAIEGGEALLYLKDQHTTFITTETNKQGEFVFDGFDFTGTVDVVVQGTDARGRRNNLLVKIDENKYVPQAPASIISYWTDGLLARTNKEYLLASNQQLAAVAEDNTNYTLRGILLKTVEVKGEQDMVTPFKLHTTPDVVISGSELAVAPSGNIIESLQGRVAGLQVYRVGPNQFRASIRGQQSSPLYLIDGVPVQESMLSGISQFDISRIEILKGVASAGVYGGRAAGGVIALYTKRGGEEPVEVEPGKYIIIHQAKGYSKVREFYSPQYDGGTPAGNGPDLRTTIYWNPSVKTDAQGNATVTFYTADRSTTYRAIAEGISDAGKPGRADITFGVNSRKSNL